MWPTVAEWQSHKYRYSWNMNIYKWHNKNLQFARKHLWNWHFFPVKTDQLKYDIYFNYCWTICDIFSQAISTKITPLKCQSVWVTISICHQYSRIERSLGFESIFQRRLWFVYCLIKVTQLTSTFSYETFPNRKIVCYQILTQPSHLILDTRYLFGLS